MGRLSTRLAVRRRTHRPRRRRRTLEGRPSRRTCLEEGTSSACRTERRLRRPRLLRVPSFQRQWGRRRRLQRQFDLERRREGLLDRWEQGWLDRLPLLRTSSSQGRLRRRGCRSPALRRKSDLDRRRNRRRRRRPSSRSKHVRLSSSSDRHRRRRLVHRLRQTFDRRP